MNPYEILGVSTHATDVEIKSAYRKQVKQFHPDVNKNQHEGIIKQLNEAYDILSDPERKAEYDRRGTVFTFEYEEDPRKVYRREYIARKREADRIKKEEEKRKIQKFEVGMKVLYRITWITTFPILLFSFLIVIDYYLPQSEYREVAEQGWQRTIRRSHSVHRRRWHTDPEVVSYMRTKNFIIAVPDDVHVDYDYFSTNKKVLTIAVSQIFKISLERNFLFQTADIEKTIFSNDYKVHYLLFISSFFMVFRKEYSHLNFCLSFIPAGLLIIVLFIMF